MDWKKFFSWGGKWKEQYKDYPETYMSGLSLWANQEAEKIMKEPKTIKLINELKKRKQEEHDKVYMEGYNKGKEEAEKDD